MPRPLQCLYYCSRSDEQTNVIFAASVSSIFSFSASDGSLLFSWPQEKKPDSIVSTATELEVNLPDTAIEPPGKRRKLSSSGNVSESTSTEIVVENGRSKRRKPRVQGSISPSVIKLVGTSDGKYLIAATGEDKCIRVFGIQADGSLETINERHMPKRPCSVTLTKDEGTILCADKFGDVYALPLTEIESSKTDRINAPLLENERPGVIPTSCSTDIKQIAKFKQKPYVPTASLSTVHTKRNQQALKNQQNTSNKVAEKRSLEFEHELLLGHVSLLTDLAYVTIKPQESSSGPLRSYIITSDRDEHIRVSRGLPQTHVIEGYCLGHTEFVSRLCIPSWSPEILVSGGGDDFLLVWDWLTGSVRQKIGLKTIVAASMNEFSERLRENNSTLRIENQPTDDSDTVSKIAVSGIWAIKVSGDDNGDDLGELVVACEGIPALFTYRITSSNVLEFHQYLLVEGNVLDVAILHGQRSFLVSMDNLHVPLSTTLIENGGNRPTLAAYSYVANSSQWTRGHDFKYLLGAINGWVAAQDLHSAKMDSKDALLSNLLYGIENLRKRGQEE